MCRVPFRCMDCNRVMVNRSNRDGTGREHQGRGLCRRCFDALRRTGELIEFEPLTRSRDEVMDDWTVLRLRGCNRRQAAEKLGMEFNSFVKAYERARAAGDPRAVVTR